MVSYKALNTIIEGIVIDNGDRTGYIYGCQVPASNKCTGIDGLHRARYVKLSRHTGRTSPQRGLILVVQHKAVVAIVGVAAVHIQGAQAAAVTQETCTYRGH